MPKSTEPDAELRALVDATGLTYDRLGELLGAHPHTVMGWYSGRRPCPHAPAIKKALQLIVLEQRGVITAKLIEQSVE